METDLHLDFSDLIHIIFHKLGIVELHIPINRDIPKKFVVVVIFIITCLYHDQMFSLFVFPFLVSPLNN